MRANLRQDKAEGEMLETRKTHLWKCSEPGFCRWLQQECLQCQHCSLAGYCEEKNPVMIRIFISLHLKGQILKQYVFLCLIQYEATKTLNFFQCSFCASRQPHDTVVLFALQQCATDEKK